MCVYQCIRINNERNRVHEFEIVYTQRECMGWVGEREGKGENDVIIL